MIDNTQLALFFLVLCRVSAFIAAFPLFTRRQLPSTVKVGLAGALSVFWFSQIDGSPEADSLALHNLHSLTAILLIAKEAVIGLALAMVVGLIFWPARVAGSYVGQELGLSLASISDPGSQDSSTLLTRIFETLSILIFFMINLHHFVIVTLHFSFDWLTTDFVLSDAPFEQIATLHNRVSDFGLLIIAPLLVGSMLVTLALAFLNRAAPSLNLFSIGMPLRAGLGIFGLVLFSPVLVAAIQTYLYRVKDDVAELFRYLG